MLKVKKIKAHAPAFHSSRLSLRCWSKIFLLIGLSAIFILKAGAVPGKLIEVHFDATIKPEEINRVALQLFRKDKGEQAPQALYSVDVYWLIYESTALNGSSTRVTGQLFIPLIKAAGEQSVYLFAPGSTGIISACRPSREHIAGIRWGQYRTHVLVHAGQGSIGMLPDYMHFSEPDKVQPYMIAEAEGRVLLDALRAVYNFFKRSEPAPVEPAEPVSGEADERTAGKRTASEGAAGGPGVKYAAQPRSGAFMGGYSQGGHAVFAAADLHARYAPEVPLAGVIGYGPSTDLVNLLKEFTVVSPLLVYVYSQIYGKEQINPAHILADRWVKNLAYDVTRLCIGSIQSYYSWNPREMYRPAFADALLKGQLAQKYPDVLRLLTANSTGLAGHKLPVLILQGTNDVVVYLKSQTQFVRNLCRSGSPVQYIIYKGGRHDTRQIGFTKARSWMAALASGEAPVSNCSEYVAP